VVVFFDYDVGTWNVSDISFLICWRSFYLFCGVDPDTFTVSKDLILPNAAWIFLLGKGGWDFFN